MTELIHNVWDIQLENYSLMKIDCASLLCVAFNLNYTMKQMYSNIDAIGRKISLF